MLLYNVFLRGLEVAKVVFVPQKPEGGYSEARFKRSVAQRLVVGTCAYVSSYARLRIAVAVALLNRGAADCVCVVAAPDLRKIAEYPEN